MISVVQTTDTGATFLTGLHHDGTTAKIKLRGNTIRNIQKLGNRLYNCPNCPTIFDDELRSLLCDLNDMLAWISRLLTTLDFAEFKRMCAEYYFRSKKYSLAISCLYWPQVCPPTLRRVTDDVPHILQVCLDLGHPSCHLPIGHVSPYLDNNPHPRPGMCRDPVCCNLPRP
jgi:hypothetical protein